jgi:NTE family protein
MGKITGLILSGGGARAAYQVGVLAAIAHMRSAARQALGDGPEADAQRAAMAANPFPIISGTSAGAINAAVLACGADDFDFAMRELVEVWGNFRVEQVYDTGVLGMVRSGARWLSLLSLGWLLRQKRLRPKSLLNNDPLRGLLTERVRFGRLPGLMQDGHVQALAITASSYSTGEHVTFFQSKGAIAPWVRNQRLAQHSPITVPHLLASAAIPFVFPAQRLEGPGGPAFFGDGSMRQTAPTSAAIHLGADRLLVIGAGRMQEPGPTEHKEPQYPNLGQIAGHALSSIFLDSLSVDVERLQRINQTLELIPPDKRTNTHLRPVDLLLIAPSQRLDVMAAEHANALPPTVQSLLRTLGRTNAPAQGQGDALLSYLLFEAPYTQAIMNLGRADALAQSAEIHRFFGWKAPT